MKKTLTTLLAGSVLALSGCGSLCTNKSNSDHYIKIKPGKYLTAAPHLQHLNEKIELKFASKIPEDRGRICSRPYNKNAIIEVLENGKMFIYPLKLEEDY
jgi:protein involved in sex pheromone biosynthesis